MHAYRKFVQDEMDKRGWTAAELSRASGLSRQNLSRLLNDDRDVLQRRPEPSTITGFARAFRMTEDQVLSYVAEAMGFKLARIPVSDVSALSNEELLRVLAERLSRGGTDEPAPDPAAAAPAPDRDDLADPAVTHGATSGPIDTNLGRSGAPAPDFAYPEPALDERPWEQDEYGLAAKRGRNHGREARQQQDREAEGGGA